MVHKLGSTSVAEAPVIRKVIPGVSGILPLLPQDVSAQLFANAASRYLKADEALFRAGDAGNGCYVLNQGLLKVVISSPQGAERILAILGPGTVAGELSVIDGRPRSASVFAIKDCDLSFISKAAFEKCAQQHPEIYRYLVVVLAGRLRETSDAVAADSFLTVKSRLARALLELAKFVGDEEAHGRIVIRHKISQSDLAAMVGIARENLSRALSDLRGCKLVTRSMGYYCLNDIAALKRAALYTLALLSLIRIDTWGGFLNLIQ
ncbi:Crp/Fnr family transcriptional regulator [Nordella sp. HKS 07]|uniref:Crp/Fnr family transcriptional regulator n=1 Tax=Nordella sp. HKS 07 TaxID=2712222 RepID=UPI0013E1C5DB|nr:Crp/Fnr family transcriptional regulator [Nordella sp. HKS 07]QIG51848.1 Crp/Fnr family transcriptional regulator [Nordella sp. HKS 07]